MREEQHLLSMLHSPHQHPGKNTGVTLLLYSLSTHFNVYAKDLALHPFNVTIIMFKIKLGHDSLLALSLSENPL